MFSNYDRELLRTGITEAKSGDKAWARRYLDRAIYMSNDHDVLAEAWFWMSQVMDEPGEKRKALESCLAHDLNHARARRAFAILDGKLRADDVIDPEHLPALPEDLHEVDAQRFMCPKCGGRMSFAPDGQSLVCEYCSRGQTVTRPGAARENDFIIAMATARAHSQPLRQQVFHCEGCGSKFILPPNQISATCAYCGSPYVVDWKSEEKLLAPDGIIPHAFSQKRAIRFLVEWMKDYKIKPEKKVEPPHGVYLPLWTFDLGGSIDYTGEEVGVHGMGMQAWSDSTKEFVQSNHIRSYPVQVHDLPIPASRKLSAVFLKLIPSFHLEDVKPYDPRYLANWPAEVYDIPMDEASLDARAQTLARYKRDIPEFLATVRSLSATSANMTVESFRLDLLPVWVTEIPFGRRIHLVLINGRSGYVDSDLPEKSGGLREFLSDLLE